MNIFDYLFRKQTIKFLGRAGLSCSFDNKTFFIDSEMLADSSNDIVIYSDSIYLKEDGRKLPVDAATKAAVISFVRGELEKRQIKADIS